MAEIQLITLDQAAEVLGVTRSVMRHIAYERGLVTVYRVPGRPSLHVNPVDLEQLKGGDWRERGPRGEGRQSRRQKEIVAP
jgi:hypothetical protein